MRFGVLSLGHYDFQRCRELQTRNFIMPISFLCAYLVVASLHQTQPPDKRSIVENADVAKIARMAVGQAFDEEAKWPRQGRQVVTDDEDNVRVIAAATTRTRTEIVAAADAHDNRIARAKFADHFSCATNAAGRSCSMTTDAIYIGVIKVDSARADGLLGVWVQRRWRPSIGALGSLATVRQYFYRQSTAGDWRFSHAGEKLAVQAR